MASWRAGAVSSAIAAGISEAMIMELGRWRSNAWRHYLLHSPLDLQGAGLRMWLRACVVKDDAALKVGVLDTGCLGRDGDDVVAAKVRKMIVLKMIPQSGRDGLRRSRGNSRAVNIV
jgi:hypothetical protein